ncbi:MAG: carboxymuconolactone decarboxylase family protein [Myxococcota bacterium]
MTASKSDGVQATLGAIQQALGTPAVPGFFQALAEAPSVLSGVWLAVEQILMSGVLPRRTKEAAIFAISAARGCDYCMLAHRGICLALGWTQDDIEQLEGKDRACVRYAVRAALRPQEIRAEHRQALRDAGVSTQEELELNAVAGLALLLNVMADAGGVPLEPGMGEAS